MISLNTEDLDIQPFDFDEVRVQWLMTDVMQFCTVGTVLWGKLSVLDCMPSMPHSEKKITRNELNLKIMKSKAPMYLFPSWPPCSVLAKTLIALECAGNFRSSGLVRGHGEGCGFWKSHWDSGPLFMAVKKEQRERRELPWSEQLSLRTLHHDTLPRATGPTNQEARALRLWTNQNFYSL